MAFLHPFEFIYCFVYAIVSFTKLQRLENHTIFEINSKKYTIYYLPPRDLLTLFKNSLIFQIECTAPSRPKSMLSDKTGAIVAASGQHIKNSAEARPE